MILSFTSDDVWACNANEEKSYWDVSANKISRGSALEWREDITKFVTSKDCYTLEWSFWYKKTNRIEWPSGAECLQIGHEVKSWVKYHWKSWDLELQRFWGWQECQIIAG